MFQRQFSHCYKLNQMIGVGTKEFCLSFEFALVLDLLVVRKDKYVAVGTRVNFELD